MTVSLNANPGQTIFVAVQVLDGYLSRVDGYTPTLDWVIHPSGATLSGFPILMSRISTGLFNASITLPSGLTNIGTYIASASWLHPDTLAPQYEVFLINSFLPFGTSSVSPA